MSTEFVMISGLGVLAVASGMLGLGVAFAAVPFLALFMGDLVHEVQPLSLLLNGMTALFATLGFARAGNIQWRRAGQLAIVTAVAAPIGSALAQRTDATLIWVLYLASVAYLAYRLFRPIEERPGNELFGRVVILAVPISILSGCSASGRASFSCRR